MNNKLFSHIFSDYYVRRYELISEMFNGLNVRIYAECSRNTEGTDNNFYALELYVSAGELNNRDYILGASFGSESMSQEEINAEIDGWVTYIIDEGFFYPDFNAYLQKEHMWDDFVDREARGETGGSE